MPVPPETTDSTYTISSREYQNVVCVAYCTKSGYHSLGIIGLHQNAPNSPNCLSDPHYQTSHAFESSVIIHIYLRMQWNVIEQVRNAVYAIEHVCIKCSCTIV